jgi:hypothetical protein
MYNDEGGDIVHEFNPLNVFLQYRDKIKTTDPVAGRKYTITQSDNSDDLFVIIAEEYADDRINHMRNEVKIEWQRRKREYILSGSVLIDINQSEVNSKIRNEIFRREMPIILKSLRFADRFLFEQYPILDSSTVIIHFASKDPAYNKSYNFGAIGNYIDSHLFK